MSRIESFSEWVSLNEQVITDHDQVYDYKKEGDKYFAKKKSDQNWREATGSAKDAIASKVFKKDVKKTQTAAPVKKDSSPGQSEIPFKNKEQGDAFRLWVNATYPVWAKKNQLDPSGSYSNKYIRSAWEKFGGAYIESKKAKKEEPKKKAEEGGFISWIRKIFPNVVQMFNKKDLTNKDFTEDQLDVIKKVVKNAIGRTKKATVGSTEYVDYGDRFDDDS